MTKSFKNAVDILLSAAIVPGESVPRLLGTLPDGDVCMSVVASAVVEARA